MKILTCVKLDFSAAHSITRRLSEKCAVVHGHNYVVEVCFTSDKPLPWVADFAQLRAVVKRVLDKLDHAYLLPDRVCRDVKVEIPEVSARIVCLPVEEVTTESLAVYIAQEIERELAQSLPGVRLVKVRVYETMDSFVEIELP